MDMDFKELNGSFYFRIVFTPYNRTKVRFLRREKTMKTITCMWLETVNYWRAVLQADETVKSFQVEKDLDHDRYEIHVTYNK